MNRWTALVVPASLALAAACTANDTTPDTAATTGNTTMATPTPTPAGTNAQKGRELGKPITTPAPSDEEDSCNASKVRARWLNALPTADVKASIAEAVGERPIRYYGEGDAITMDYSEARLNVVLGKDGRINEFRCG